MTQFLIAGAAMGMSLSMEEAIFDEHVAKGESTMSWAQFLKTVEVKS